MHDVDRPAHVQALSQPTRARRPRVDAEPLRLVSRSQDLDSIAAHLRRARDLGQEPAVRASEAKLAIRLSVDLVALLVDGESVVGPPCAQ
jgi:hypothetical protein